MLTQILDAFPWDKYFSVSLHTKARALVVHGVVAGDFQL